jgi:hypothetical protein
LLIKVQVRASLVRFGDRLVAGAQRPELELSHGASRTRLMGDPLVWVLRNEPWVIEEEELPESIWRPRGPRRTQPWEGVD